MHKKKNTLAAFMLLPLVVGCALSKSDRKEVKTEPLEGFPGASLTIFPMTITITGPVEKHQQFADALEGKFRKEARHLADTLGLLLEEKGYDEFEMTDTDFRFPQGKAARKERAAAFSKFVSELDLKTDYALCSEMTLHIERSWQEVYSIIVDAEGAVVWEDSRRRGNPDFDAKVRGGPETGCELICRRLTPVMNLDKLSKKELSSDRAQALQQMRREQPPDRPEQAAIKKRLAAMKKAGASARVMVYPARVGGDHADPACATQLSTLLNEAGLCQASVSKTAPVMEGSGWPNEMHVLWLCARNVREYVREHPADSDYVLFADYWFNPRGQVWAVHFVVCDRAGDWVIVDLQNSHHKDFQRVEPKTLADCDRLVLERLKKHLR